MAIAVVSSFITNEHDVPLVQPEVIAEAGVTCQELIPDAAVRVTASPLP